MERESTFTQMGVTTLEIGPRAKCKAMGSCLTLMVILSTRASGKMIIFKVRESSITTLVVMTGSSTKGSSGLETRRGLGSCFTRMEIGTRGSSEITCHGVRGECLVRMGRS